MTTGIVTSTRYPDLGDHVQSIRSKLAIVALAQLVDAGYDVYVNDGGSDPSFFGELRHLGLHLTIDADLDMMGSRHLAMKAAVADGHEHIAWTEPEKAIAPLLPEWVRSALTLDAAFVLPMRSSTETYPVHQQISELAGNRAIADCFGREMGDWYFGPSLMTRAAAVGYWLAYDGTFGSAGRLWPCLFAPVYTALAAGERVVGVASDFTYPAEQSAAESDDSSIAAKRDQQLTALTEAAVHARDNLTWADGWSLLMPGGFSLASQRRSPGVT